MKQLDSLMANEYNLTGKYSHGNTMLYMYYIRLIVIILGWLTLFGWAFSILVMGKDIIFLAGFLGNNKYSGDLTGLQFVVVILLQTVLVATLSRCFFKLAKVLNNCLKEKVIANVIVEQLQSLAKNVLLFCLLTLIMQPVIEFVLVFNLPEGEKSVSVSASFWLLLMMLVSSTLIPVLKLLRRETIQAF
ncbi:hypothetical protein CF392_06985 [Tamilnaduibacter salinus]|uniref:Uncharacterized protein n=1 Tax=Tamilnaduibacter salinus TaxID=1484056 RepID=A0A2A2I5A8_9GAMM|nr:hypothetical protein [Tamilnaduibacter salinus]PAV26213.1 hypothetical protein CF392_06985 [Tamilnaduibacter salinus]